MIFLDVFTAVIYQPFLNVLIGMYWLMDLVTGGQADMGFAVILMTLLIRFLLLPVSIAGWKSEAQRREIAAKLKALELEHANNPAAYKKARKKVFTKSRRVVIGELVSLAIQVSISLMLWRMFGRGLTGADLHLIYPFMPEVEQPFNLLFLGTFDLSHGSLTLNFIQAGAIFVLESLAVLVSPYPHSRAEVVRLQLTLPVISFLLFLQLPAGKKLFVITTLVFSIVLTIIRYIRQRFLAYQEKWEQREAAEESGEVQEEKLVQVVK